MPAFVCQMAPLRLIFLLPVAPHVAYPAPLLKDIYLETASSALELLVLWQVPMPEIV